MSEADPEQLAAVLEQIAEYSRSDQIRDDIREVVAALRGTGFIVVNGPPQEEMRRRATDG